MNPDQEPEFTITPPPGELVQNTIRLDETSVEERKKAAENRPAPAKRRADTRKIVSKAAVQGIDNLDSVFELLQGIAIILLSEFARRGDWLNVAVFTLAATICYLLKIRMPIGGFTKMAKSSGDQLKAKLIDISQTLVR